MKGNIIMNDQENLQMAADELMAELPDRELTPESEIEAWYDEALKRVCGKYDLKKDDLEAYVHALAEA